MTLSAPSAKTLLHHLKPALNSTALFPVHGRVIQVVGAIVKALIPGVQMGELCTLHDPASGLKLKAEVVGFQENHALLTPMGDMQGLSTA